MVDKKGIGTVFEVLLWIVLGLAVLVLLVEVGILTYNLAKGGASNMGATQNDCCEAGNCNTQERCEACAPSHGCKWSVSDSKCQCTPTLPS